MEQLFEISSTSRGIKRKAELIALNILLKEEIVRVDLLIRFFENNGTEINYDTNPGIEPYPRLLRAHNRTLVNPDNDGTPVITTVTEATYDAHGEELTPRIVEHRDMETNEVVLNPVGYFDFFFYIMKNVPTVVMDAIATNIAFEDLNGGLNKKDK